MVSGLVIYVLDLVYRILRRRSTAALVAANCHPASVLELTLVKKKFYFHPGQYVLLHCPKVSLWEWHPFTITSSTSGQSKFTLHLRTRGDWSHNLSIHLLGGRTSLLVNQSCMTLC
ncbi:NADPH oxidase 1-like isoform X2 [Limulus polyphemus]|uniref:NADPH oxidase 1-like isoform X2 n=1 Tax=Limulus polyphemus TaxID=6850 RepID=A0ABM1T0N3_LIMPO|nr:NADPH oxidase 1-like isoform X2 [Limulus polyphemus]